MNVISLTIADDLEIEMTLDRGKLAYTFERNGKRYGNAVKLSSRKSLHGSRRQLLFGASAFGWRGACRWLEA